MFLILFQDDCKLFCIIKKKKGREKHKKEKIVVKREQSSL